MLISPPFNLQKWIEEHRHLLKPPVGNSLVFPNGDFMIMAVGGPNARKDYHIDDGAEFFYQVQGDVTVRLLENGQPRDITIKEGDVFLLPPRVPHSPQRPANTVGLVIERKREGHEKDGFLWICDSCNEKLYEEFVHVTDIVNQLPKVFDHFYGNTDLTTCKKCGTVAKR